MLRLEEQDVLRSSVNGRLIRNTCYGTEVAQEQCKRSPCLLPPMHMPASHGD